MVVDEMSRATSFARKTADEINTVADSEGSILVVPVGSIEQHGPHLPVGTDTILVTEISHLGAERVKESVPVLVAPPVWLGNSSHHLSFGGTLTADPADIETTLSNIADSAVDIGFNALVYLNGHGGNSSLVSTAVNRIGDNHQDREVVGCTYFKLAASFVDEIRESQEGGTGHAGEFETSLLLALRPEMVDEDATVASIWESAYDDAANGMFSGGQLSAYRTMDEYTETGVSGDATLGTAAKGRELYDGLGNKMETLLHQVHERSRT